MPDVTAHINERLMRGKPPLHIGLTFDLKPQDLKEGEPPDFFAEHDTEETVSLIEGALKKYGHNVMRIGPAKELLKRPHAVKYDIVFNIAEGLPSGRRGFSGRNRESEAPVILEMMGIPFVGSDALTLSASLDKIISKKIFSYLNIPTPVYFECSSGNDVSIPRGFVFPAIVKPRYEGSAKGIDPGSKVDNPDALKKKISRIIQDYKQPVLVEKFINGWEFTVGIIGNDYPAGKGPLVLPVVQRHLEIKTNLSSHIFEKSGIDKALPLGDRKAYPVDKDGLRYEKFLEIEPELEAEIKGMALAAFRGLECRDFARLDFRVSKSSAKTAKPKIYLLEINPLPSLSKDDYFAMTAELLGISYDEMINDILDAALNRCRCR